MLADGHAQLWEGGIMIYNLRDLEPGRGIELEEVRNLTTYHTSCLGPGSSTLGAFRWFGDRIRNEWAESGYPGDCSAEL
jgi:hypothetical protein